MFWHIDEDAYNIDELANNVDKMVQTAIERDSSPEDMEMIRHSAKHVYVYFNHSHGRHG